MSIGLNKFLTWLLSSGSDSDPEFESQVSVMWCLDKDNGEQRYGDEGGLEFR